MGLEQVRGLSLDLLIGMAPAIDAARLPIRRVDCRTCQEPIILRKLTTGHWEALNENHGIHHCKPVKPGILTPVAKQKHGRKKR